VANKFVGIEPQEPGTALIKPAQMGMDGGFRGDVSPRSLQPGETPVLDDIRFERTAIRKDFGWQAIGAAATTAIRGLIEHKFISEGLEFSRLVRVTVDASDFAIIEIWDGANWVFVDTSDPITVNDIYFSILSAQGALYMSEGSQILCWLEDFATVTNEDDFDPATNNLFRQGQSTIVVVSPAFPPGLLEYTIVYNVTFNRVVTEVGEGDVVVIQFKHEGTPLGTAVHSADRNESFPLNTGPQEFIFNAQILDLDEVTAEIIQIRTDNVIAGNDVSNFAGPGFPVLDPQNIVEKTGVFAANDDSYRITTFLPFFGDPGCFATLEYFVDDGDGIFVSLGPPIQFAAPSLGGDVTYVIPDLNGPNVRWGVNMVSQIGGCGTFANFTRVRYTTRFTDLVVHCNNKAVQGDPEPGITYGTSGVAQSTFEPIVPGPGARYLIHFARRLIALQDLGDRQVFSFSADGLLTEFDNIDLGSGKLFLVDTRSDGIDALQGGAVLNSNFLAVFRQRSIMRAFETGNLAQAIGVVTWIENLGTNCPFSIRNVVGGVMFLGHDSMVYFLTEQGAVGVGLPIHQEIIEDLTGDLSLVDSGYDPTFGEYYLGYPVGPDTEITKVWVFDVDRWNEKRETVWRRKPMDVQRFATGGISEVL
jgi:hypothetical protein